MSGMRGLRGPTFRSLDLAEIEIVENINDAEAIASLRTAAPDIILVFGTGKLHAEVINVVT